MKIRDSSCLACLAALLYGLAIAPARADYSINFNNGSDAGLTHYDPLAPFGSGATYTFPNGGYRLTSGPSASLTTLGPPRVGSFQGSQSFGDFRMTVDIVAWDNQLDQDIGLGARLSNIGLGTSSGYFLHYNPLSGPVAGGASLVIDRIDGEQATDSNAFVPLTRIDPQLGFRLVFTGIGSLLTGQVFALNNLNTALATVTFTDSTYNSGFTGVLLTGFAAGPNTNVDATFDNLTVSSVPEPASVAMLGIGLVGLGIARFRRERARAG